MQVLMIYKVPICHVLRTSWEGKNEQEGLHEHLMVKPPGSPPPEGSDIVEGVFSPQRSPSGVWTSRLLEEVHHLRRGLYQSPEEGPFERKTDFKSSTEH